MPSHLSLTISIKLSTKISNKLTVSTNYGCITNSLENKNIHFYHDCFVFAAPILTFSCLLWILQTCRIKALRCCTLTHCWLLRIIINFITATRAIIVSYKSSISQSVENKNIHCVTTNRRSQHITFQSTLEGAKLSRSASEFICFFRPCRRSCSRRP